MKIDLLCKLWYNILYTQFIFMPLFTGGHATIE